MIFSNPNIILASTKHISYIKELVDSAYRGETSKQGWTTEAEIIKGSVRASINMVEEALLHGNILIYLNNNDIVGCVHLQTIQVKIYLGMFAVKPNLQGGGIGKELLRASEEYATKKEISCIFMKVISIRTELINWYKKYGYKETGVLVDFLEDGISGQHVKPLQFLELEKEMI